MTQIGPAITGVGGQYAEAYGPDVECIGHAQLAPEGCTVQAGGFEWADAPKVCKSLTKKLEPCPNPPVEGKDFCIGHQRQQEARQRRSS